MAYAAGNAAAYQQMMGRWSQRLAVSFLDFAAIGEADHVLDVGCGTGNLAFAVAQRSPRTRIVGVDPSPAFLDYAKAHAADPRVVFEQGDATSLAHADETFQATLALLVLNFVPQYETAAREMLRVTKPGGVVAAAAWDFAGGLTYTRILLDTAAALDPDAQAARAKIYTMPLTRFGELGKLWRKVGLRDVEEISLTIRMEFSSFADYWEPWLSGQGTVGPYAAGLKGEKKALVEHHVRLAYLAGGADGPRSFTATASAVRGIK